MERKVATVLFADLVDSTGLGEGDPEQTRALLERFYAAMAEEVEQAGGTVEKFAGDAVMAAFGGAGRAGGPRGAGAARRPRDAAASARRSGDARRREHR